AINTLNKPWHIVGLVACLLLAPAADAAIGLAQFASGDGPPSFRIAAGSPFVRAYGTIGAPNSFAGYMNMAWPLALALGAGAILDLRRLSRSKIKNQKSKMFLALGSWLLMGLLLAALGASFSRGGWVGAAIGLLAMTIALGQPLA